MKKVLLTLLIIISFLAAFCAEAVSIKASPSELKIETNSELTKKEITIENPGSNVGLFEVYIDSFSDWVKINPESFILEAGKSQKVILEIRNRGTGVFSTTLSVVAKPLSEREFKANAGVKIPLEIRIIENESQLWLASILEKFVILFKNHQILIYLFGIIFILSLLVFFYIKRKK